MKKIQIAAIQPNAQECYTEEQFYKKVYRLSFIAKQSGAKVIVFPEGLSFWLSFAKEAPRVSAAYYGHCFKMMRTQKGWRGWLEALSDWFLKRVKLNFMGEWLCQAKFYRVTQRTFSRVAKECGVVIVAGSIYARRLRGMENISMVFDKDGSMVGEVGKKYLMPVEESWGMVAAKEINPVMTSEGSLGVCICADLNFPDVVADLKTKGAEFICAPSGGWRPYPGYPFDEVKDMPQKERAKESGLWIVRPYQCGWMIPGVYFDGRTSVVNSKGEVVERAEQPSQEEIIVCEIETA